MTLQYSTTVRDARLDQVETTVGVSPTLEVRTGVPPANCAAADTGTVLATMTLPVDWMAAASGGTKAISGTWQDLLADASGAAGHFRIKAGVTCHIQGTAGQSGGGADMQFDNATFVAGQGPITVTAFTLTEGNP